MTIDQQSAVAGNLAGISDVTGTSSGAASRFTGAYGGAGGAAFGRNAHAGNGGNGGSPGTALGGGIFTQAGGVIVSNGSSVNGNKANGTYTGAVTSHTARILDYGGRGGSAGLSGAVPGKAGSGGNGASAFGGGIYASGAVQVLSGSHLDGNAANAGIGGSGGTGGGLRRGPNSHAGPVQPGGAAGLGGNAAGGGAYVAAGSITVDGKSTVDGNSLNQALLARYAPDSSHRRRGYGSHMVMTVHGGHGGLGGIGGHASGLGAMGAGSASAGGSGGSALGGGIYAAGSSVSVTIEHGSKFENNVALGGTGGTGGHGGVASSGAHGDGGAGGSGGVGGAAEGGAIYAAGGNVSVSNSAAVGASTGTGGVRGGAGGAGGAGGTGEGGGIFATSGTVVISGSTLSSLHATGGAGGDGGVGGKLGGPSGNAGAGGNGGIGAGGAIATASGPVKLSHSIIGSTNVAPHTGYSSRFSNVASGGQGGMGGAGMPSDSSNGGNGGSGGDGGPGIGGGVYTLSGPMTLSGANTIAENLARGGQGNAGGQAGFGALRGQAGAGGNGGLGAGGGLATSTGTITVSGAGNVVEDNDANGGHGSRGGNGAESRSAYIGPGGDGGLGGNSLGGGLYVGSSGASLVLLDLTVSTNTAGIGTHVSGSDTNRGGNGGSGTVSGLGGAAGMNAGGGIYVSAGSTLKLTASSVLNNVVHSLGGGGAGSRQGNGGNALGGGIFAGGTTGIVSSTIAQNDVEQISGINAYSSGGGLYVAPSTAVAIDNSTIVYNTQTGDYVPGIVPSAGIRNDGTLTLLSSVVADNQLTNERDVVVAESDLSDAALATFPAGTTTATYSLIASTSSNSLTPAGNNIVNQFPTLSPLVSTVTGSPITNGTQGYFLEKGSYGLGAGSNPLNLATDQFGNERTVFGTTDIGSVQSPSYTTAYFVMATTNGYVRVVNQNTGEVIQNFQPFPGYTGPVRVAEGDILPNSVDHPAGTRDLLVAAKGKVLVYDGVDVAATQQNGQYIDLGNPATWTNLDGTSNLNPSNPLAPGTAETSPVLATIMPFGSYTGPLFVATGDVNGDGHSDIIVGTGGTITGTVAVFSGANPLAPLAAQWHPFGATYKGGVSVAAGNLIPGQPAEVIAGSTNLAAKMRVYAISGGAATQQGGQFTAFPGAAGINLSVVYPNGPANNAEVVAYEILNGVGYVRVFASSGSGGSFALTQKNSFSVGSHLTGLAVTQFTPGSAVSELLVAAIPNSTNNIRAYTLAGAPDPSEVFGGFSALTGGISLSAL